MQLQSVASSLISADVSDREEFQQFSGGHVTSRNSLTIARLKRNRDSRFLLLKLPEMSMLGKLLLTHEKAPVRLMLGANVLKGYEGSYRISFGDNRTATMEIRMINQDNDLEPSNEWPCMGVVETSIPGIVVNASGLDCCSQIVVRPDQPWLETYEEYHVFEFNIGELLSVNAATSNEMSFAIAVIR